MATFEYIVLFWLHYIQHCLDFNIDAIWWFWISQVYNIPVPLLLPLINLD